VLAIPIMVFLLGMSAPKAVATNSVIIIATTTLSAYFHWRQGTLKKEGILLGIGGIIGTFFGNALFFYASSQGWMRYVLGISFITIGFVTLLRMNAEKEEIPNNLALFLIGIATGAFAALLGMSGGILLNVVLVTVLGIDIKIAIGLSVAALPVISIASAIPKVISGYADLAVALSFIPGVIIGTKLGAKMMKGMKSKTLKKLFVVFMIAIGLKFLF